MFATGWCFEPIEALPRKRFVIVGTGGQAVN